MKIKKHIYIYRYRILSTLYNRASYTTLQAPQISKVQTSNIMTKDYDDGDQNNSDHWLIANQVHSTVLDTSLYSPLNTGDHSIMSPPASRLPLITTSKVAAGLAPVVKNPLANARDIKGYRLDPCVGKIPWKRKWQPTPIFLPEKPHGQRSQAGYSPWGRKPVWHNLATKQFQRALV